MLNYKSLLCLIRVNLYNIYIRGPTTKAVGSTDVTKLEPTASVVGATKRGECFNFCYTHN
jgi:hypothetical protein